MHLMILELNALNRYDVRANMGLENQYVISQTNHSYLNLPDYDKATQYFFCLYRPHVILPKKQ